MAKLKTGKADVAQDAPAHTPGVKGGGELGSYEKQPGHNPDGTSTAERSTGVNAKTHGPIDPRMPNLSPA
ncbi:MAG: hypothetical protein ACR2NV_05200 [Thermoleophilaceae bacterium]|jgi:hypothetical protein